MAKQGAINDQNYLLPLEFQKGSENDPTNSTLQDFLNRLGGTNHENDIKKVVKEIVRVLIAFYYVILVVCFQVALYTASKDNRTLHIEARNVTIELFTRFNGKKQLKKYVQDLVTKQNLANEIIKSTAQFLLDKIKDEKTCDLKKCSEFLHFVSVLQTSPNYDFEENFRPLFPLYMSLFDSFAIYARQV